MDLRRGDQLAGFPERLAAVGDQQEVLAWIAGRGIDTGVVSFASSCAAVGAIAPEEDLAPALVQGSAAFLAGFLAALFLAEEAGTPGADTAQLVSDAIRIVVDRGRLAVIADHCDLSDVATLETAICDELAAQAPSCPESQRRRLRVVLVRLFEGGLAVGLAATAPVVGASA